MYKRLLPAILLASIASTQAFADMKTVCSHGGETRVIEVVYTGEGKVPCEVRYTKSEGSKTLWSAQNKEGYCEEKAATFVEKQEGWGWSCKEDADEMAPETTTEEPRADVGMTE